MSMTRLNIACLLILTLLAPAAAAQDASEGAFADAATLDLVWVFMAAVLVFLMQGGFALLGAGAVRAKNTVN